MSPSRQTWSGGWAPVLAVTCAATLAAASHAEGQSALAVLLFAGLGMTAASFGASTVAPRTVFITSLVLAALGLAGQPLFEDDFYRYLWDGYRTAVAGSPYGLPPEAFFDDPTVPVSFRGILDGVNNPEVPTLYGPVLQGLFHVGYLVAPGEERLLRGALAVANLGLVSLLLKGHSAGRVALYAWNPLVFKEVCLSGHPDALVALILIAGWLGRRQLGGRAFAIALGLAAGVKIVAILAGVMLLRGRRPVSDAAIAGLAFVCAYAPFLLSDGGGEFAGLSVFATRWQFNPGLLFRGLSGITGAEAARFALAPVTLGAAIVCVRLAGSEPRLPPLHRMFGALLLASPVINPWYLLWGAAAAVGSRDVWPWIASFALLLSYARGEVLGDGRLQPFEIAPWALTAQWGLILAALAADAVRASRRPGP